MHRGHVLAVAFTLAAALQLVFVPTASADGGLLDGLTSILSSNPQGESDSQTQEDDGLLDGLLGPVAQLSQPLTGDLLDASVEELDSALETVLGESLSDTAAEIASPLEGALIPALAPTTGLTPPETPAEVPSASASVAAPPATPPALPDILVSALPTAGDVIQSLTPPLEPVVADVALPLVGTTDEPALLPTAPVAHGLMPLAEGLSPALQPLLQVLNPVAFPVLKLVEPVVTPILHAIDPLLQPFAGLLRTAGGPVVDVILPPSPSVEGPLVPGAAAPPPPGQASTAGSSFDQTDLSPGTSVFGTAFLTRVLSEVATDAAASGASSVRENETHWLTRPDFSIIEVQAHPGSAGPEAITEVPQRPPSSASAGPDDRGDSSLTSKTPVADLAHSLILFTASFAVFLLVFGSRSQSWLSCPVRPPI